ncbi:MAG: hypothetical protein AB1505_00390 [Candidatus Latescibacterota bacterium]
MDGRERLRAIFEGERVERVPFALKGWRIPQCAAELRLRQEGMCILDARSVYAVVSPNVETRADSFTEGGVGYVRTAIRTPAGELSALTRQAGGTTWRLEFPFKGPEDYRALKAMVRDRRYLPSYEGFLQAQERVGGEAYFKTGAPGAPLHEVIYSFMGLDTFATEWAERRDEVLALVRALADSEREAFVLTARSPARLVQIGGNYSPEVLGKPRFLEHVQPHWEEACGILHEGGKLVGCHLDADNRLWAAEVGASPLDWIEAFTPAPDTDMSLADARQAWPGKTLFINFPSSVHLQAAPQIAATTRQLLREAAPGDRFVVGITETVPEDRWPESFTTILRTLNECGRLPVDPSAL